MNGACFPRSEYSVRVIFSSDWLKNILHPVFVTCIPRDAECDNCYHPAVTGVASSALSTNVFGLVTNFVTNFRGWMQFQFSQLPRHTSSLIKRLSTPLHLTINNTLASELQGYKLQYLDNNSLPFSHSLITCILYLGHILAFDEGIKGSFWLGRVDRLGNLWAKTITYF